MAQNKTLHLTFYTKDCCHLCWEVKQTLCRLQRKFDFSFHEVDIVPDLELYERYKNIIPVLSSNGQDRLWGRIEEGEIRQLLAGLKSSVKR